jgi:hypothetical protein
LLDKVSQPRSAIWALAEWIDEAPLDQAADGSVAEVLFHPADGSADIHAAIVAERWGAIMVFA